MSSGATQATGPARGAGVDPAALASDLDEPVVVGERAQAVGAAGADASLAQQRAERTGEARAMLGKKGTPSLFKFGFKVVPRTARCSAAASAASARRAARPAGPASQCWRGHASGCALRGVVGCLSWRPATPTKIACIRAWPYWGLYKRVGDWWDVGALCG
jgi:hypothetical protein